MQRVLVVDDNPGFFPVLRSACEKEKSFKVVGYATSGREALEKAAELQPDLILMDLDMPGMSGLETTRRLKQRTPQPSVVIVTLHDGPEYEMAARDAGAISLVTKSALGSKLGPIIRTLSDSTPAS